MCYNQAEDEDTVSMRDDARMVLAGCTLPNIYSEDKEIQSWKEANVNLVIFACLSAQCLVVSLSTQPTTWNVLRLLLTRKM